jgi:hypothetical protein
VRRCHTVLSEADSGTCDRLWESGTVQRQAGFCVKVTGRRLSLRRLPWERWARREDDRCPFLNISTVT